MERNLRAYSLIKTLFVLIALATAACHREVAMPPLPLRNITLTDKFFDVWPTSPTRAFVVGDRGKVLLTEDGGRHFKRIDIGTQLGIFGIQMTDDQNGYLCGQDGLVMRTRDGGKTWERLNSRTHLFIFGLSFPDAMHGLLCRRPRAGAEHDQRRREFHQAPVAAALSAGTGRLRAAVRGAGALQREFSRRRSRLGGRRARANLGDRKWRQELAGAAAIAAAAMETSARAQRRSALRRFSAADFFQRLVPRSKAWRGVRTRGMGDTDRRRRQDLALCASGGQAGRAA